VSLVELARFDNRIEAEVARLNLESDGINAVLFDAEISHFYGGWFLPIRLMVLDDDLADARQLLATP
jgi:Putative prokaryotic signal transducing protein